MSQVDVDRDGLPRTAADAIDRAAWRGLMSACSHDAQKLDDVDGRPCLWCPRCKMVLSY